MEQVGEDTGAEQSVEQESPEEDRAAAMPARSDRLGTAISLGAAGVITAGIIRWESLPPSTRYLWPRSAEDWASWGTWAGSFGAIGAVFFAAQSIKHTIEAQKGTERELKADREHDRIERDKERNLVREERKALTEEADQIALRDARRLSFTYRWGPPTDDEYGEVQYRNHKAEERFHEAGLVAEEESDDRQLLFAHVVITNSSKHLSFDDVSLFLVETNYEITGASVAERDAPARRTTSEALPGLPPKWIWRDEYDRFFAPGSNQWALGSIKAGKQVMLKLAFAQPQSYNDWDPINLWQDEKGYSQPRHLILGYRDESKRHWVRSTRSSRNEPQRLLEAKTLA